MTARILFVCLGNICRSPTAEAVVRARAAARGLEIAVDSAGTGDWHIGAPPHPPAIRAAAARGYDLTPLRARQVAPGDFGDFDLIVAMDRQNLSDLAALRPAGSATPLRLMTGFTGGLPAEVPDPYFTGDFDGALDLIETAADALLDALASGAAPGG